jgi:hypothetical protein
VTIPEEFGFDPEPVTLEEIETDLQIDPETGFPVFEVDADPVQADWAKATLDLFMPGTSLVPTSIESLRYALMDRDMTLLEFSLWPGIVHLLASGKYDWLYDIFEIVTPEVVFIVDGKRLTGPETDAFLASDAALEPVEGEV